MLSIVVSTKKEDLNFKEETIKKCGLGKDVEFLFYVNKGKHSLTKIYNKGLKESKYNNVVFMHDDVIIETTSWGKKLLKHFETSDFGIIGMAGTKYLSETGRWWDNKKYMCGRVKHTDGNKVWQSNYSPDIKNNIEDVVLVDGLFIAVQKDRLKENFSEDVKGFHLYDVDFSIKNHLKGVRIGVITNIRVLHKSVGATNQEWEDNKKYVVNKFAEHLPIGIKEEFKNRPLRVLLSCLSFANLTGSEISTFELAKGLRNKGCEVGIITQHIGSPLNKMAIQYGITLYDINTPPSYLRGDGKWLYKGQVSNPGNLYRVAELEYDVIQCNHTPITKRLLELYPDVNKVNIVRSEIIDLENPLIDNTIKKYIAIRPSIKDYLVDKFSIEDKNIEMIYNLFDKNRFKFSDKKENSILFVGTMDYLRKEPIYDLVNQCKDENKELWLVGKDTSGYATELSNQYEFVKYFGQTNKVEEYFEKCGLVSGIMLGRTAIEGFLCGKDYLQYDVDKKGNIINKELINLPKDLSEFDNNNILDRYINLYKEIYNKK